MTGMQRGYIVAPKRLDGGKPDLVKALQAAWTSQGMSPKIPDHASVFYTEQDAEEFRRLLPEYLQVVAGVFPVVVGFEERTV